MKPTDPTPEEYTNWIIYKIYTTPKAKELTKTILTELRDNSTT